MVQKVAAVRRAMLMARLSNAQQKPQSATEFVKYSKSVIEFQILTLQSELSMLEGLAKLADDKEALLKTLFDLIDHDRTGVIHPDMIAGGLGQIQGAESWQEECVHQTIAEMRNKTENGTTEMLDQTSFAKLVEETLVPAMGCSLQEMTEMLVMKVVFSEENVATYHTPALDVLDTSGDSEAAENEEETEATPRSNNRTTSAATAAVKVDPSLRHAMKDRRMKALFHVFEGEEGMNTVDFKHVVVGMYKMLEGLDEASHAAVTALLLFDEQHTRELTYKDFARLILNVVASSPDHVTFDEIADTLTRNAIRASSGITEQYVLEQFSMDKKTSQLLLDIENDEDIFVNMHVVELAKLDRLFHLFDVSHAGSISATDLALGLQKFHDTSGLKTTVEETQHVMHEFNKNADGQLSKREFATFVVNFASSAGVELIDMLDFMIVVSALKNNTKAEQEYMNTLERKDAPFSYSYG